jgi:tetratricopeptide (TPR) repeat protein
MLDQESIERYIVEAEAAYQEIFGPNQLRWLQWVKAENANICRSIDRCLADSTQIERVYKLGSYVWRVWSPAGYVKEGHEKLLAILGCNNAAVPNDVRGRFLLGIGTLSQQLGKLEDSERYYRESYAIAETMSDPVLKAETLIGMGEIAFKRSNYENASSCFNKGLALFRTANSLQGIAKALRGIGVITYWQKAYDESFSCLSESLEIARTMNNDLAISDCLVELGNLSYQIHERHKKASGDDQYYTRASSYFQEAIEILQRLGDKDREGVVWNSRSIIAAKNELHHEAIRYAENAVAVYRDLSIPQKEGYALINLAASQTTVGDFREARRNLKRSLTLIKPLEDLSGSAVAIEEVARLMFDLEKYEESVTLYGAARGLRESIAISVSSDDLIYYLNIQDDLKTKVNPKRYTQLTNLGMALSFDDACSYAISVVEDVT